MAIMELDEVGGMTDGDGGVSRGDRLRALFALVVLEMRG